MILLQSEDMSNKLEKTELPLAVSSDVVEARLAVALAQRAQKLRANASALSKSAPPSRPVAEVVAEKAELLLPRNSEGVLIPLNPMERKDIVRNDKLRQQFTGCKGGHAERREKMGKQIGAGKLHLDDESDNEEGRSRLFKAKAPKASDEPRQRAVHPAAMKQNLALDADLFTDARPTQTLTVLSSQKSVKDKEAATKARTLNSSQKIPRQEKRTQYDIDVDDDDGRASVVPVTKIPKFKPGNISTTTASSASDMPDPIVLQARPILMPKESGTIVSGMGGTSDLSNIDAVKTHTRPSSTIGQPILAKATRTFSKADRKREKKKLAKKARKERDRRLKTTEIA